MEAIAVPVLDALDSVRSWLLRTLLSFSFAKTIFVSRARRLQFLFLVVFFTSLILSAAAPLWVLAAGPLLYGFPHILASLRFSHHTLANKSLNRFQTPHHSLERASRTFQALSMVWIAVLSFRLFTQFNFLKISSDIKAGNSPELLATVLTIIICRHIHTRAKYQTLISLMLLTPLALSSLYAPGTALGALVLLHNFVAFAFWYRSCQSTDERKVALKSLGLFTLANVAIFGGACDFINTAVCGSIRSILHDALCTEDIGRLIAPWSEDPTIYLRCAIAYAFGQSLHYFIWLKAMPDQFHTRSTPTTFRQSFHILTRDYGRHLVGGMTLFCAIGFAIYVCFEYSMARAIYFSFAAYHGYLEIAVLSFAVAGSYLRSKAMHG